MGSFQTISFLSDYGQSDEFVGVVKSVIRSIEPSVTVIDITHDIAAHDVRAGGLALARSAQYLAPGVVLAVVDPGVGTERRSVAIEVGDGQSCLVGPDNGLFAPAVSMVGGATGAVVLDNPEYQLPAIGQTFAGRDVFAPVAAHLCAGVPFDELGTRIEPGLLLPGVLPVSQVEDDGSVTAEVLWIDRFGNAQLNVDPGDLGGWSEVVSVSGGDQQRNATRVETFSQIVSGGIGMMVDSYGLLALSADRRSAAAELGVAEGDQLTLRSVDDGPAAANAASPSPVTLRSKPLMSEQSVSEQSVSEQSVSEQSVSEQ